MVRRDERRDASGGLRLAEGKGGAGWVGGGEREEDQGRRGERKA